MLRVLTSNSAQVKLVFYGKFVFSRPDLDKPAKQKCLAKKVRDREVSLLRVIYLKKN